MKGKSFTPEQIIRILQEVEAGAAVAEVSRRHEVAEQTIYRWRAKYGGLDVSDAKRLKALEEENGRLKRIVAQQALDVDASRNCWQKNGEPSRPAGRRALPAAGERLFRTARLCLGRGCPLQSALPVTEQG